MDKDLLRIKRTHGLGNIVMLLPVLKTLSLIMEKKVILYTKEEYFCLFDFIDFREFILLEVWNSQLNIDIDLDSITAETNPFEHRVDEYYRILDVKPGHKFVEFILDEATLIKEMPFDVNPSFNNTLIVCPEAGHPSRTWNSDRINTICNHWLKYGEVVLIGERADHSIIPCSIDFRGSTSLKELLFLIRKANTVLCMDSGIMHIAAGFKKPMVAIFGNVNPLYRIKYYSNCIAIFGNVKCFPCNKKENCEEYSLKKFECINRIKADHVLQALNLISSNPNLFNQCKIYCSMEEELVSIY